MDLRNLCRGQRHLRDARRHSSGHGCGRPLLSGKAAPRAGAGRGRPADTVGALRSRRQQGHRPELVPRPRSVSRHQQSRLFPHQNRAVDPGRPDADPGRHRHRAAAPKRMIPAAGLGLLVLVALGIVFTGLPAFVILIGAATIGATLGVASDTVPLSLLGALPSRLINLFENDLLQALPLYVTMGLLLDRLPIADALYRAGLSLLPRRPAATLVSGMALGALLGPMNGSVGASVLALSRVIAPRLAESGAPRPTQFATVAVASTLGVVIPPSLVLILLGDAMLSAHTIAVTSTGRSDRVINTQDVFHGALAPAAIFLALCFALSWRAGRRIPPSAAPPPVKLTRKQAILAAITLVALLTLLGGVATGYFYAVEAAAMGAFVLLSAGFVTGALRGPVLRGLLHDTLAITGALFALLIAATTLTLVLRL